MVNVAEQYPARTDSNGTTWFRPARGAGLDFSQWGWTSDPAQAHPDYGTGPHIVRHASGAAALCGGPGACMVCHVVEREAPAQAKAAERAAAYGEAFGELLALTAADDRAEGDRIPWGDPQRVPGQLAAEVRPLPGGGIAFVPTEPLPTETAGELPDGFVEMGYVDETSSRYTLSSTLNLRSAMIGGTVRTIASQEAEDQAARAFKAVADLVATVNDQPGLW